jgi:hypothetical protein
MPAYDLALPVGVHIHFRDYEPCAVALALEDVKGMVVSLVDDTAVEQFLSFDEEVDRHQDDLIREDADAALGGRFERSGVEVGVGEQAARGERASSGVGLRTVDAARAGNPRTGRTYLLLSAWSRQSAVAKKGEPSRRSRRCRKPGGLPR